MRPISQDEALIKYITEKDIGAVKRLLEQGANPEAKIGNKRQQNAMCQATDHSTAEYVQLLVEYGASVNAYWPDSRRGDYRTPLVCSVSFLNLKAFHYLLENGADPSVNLNPKATNSLRDFTALAAALDGSRYTMALELVSRYELTDKEFYGLKFNLNRYSFSQAHPWNYAREALIDWVKEREPDFVAAPSNPPVDGKYPDCIFMFRDYEEGLKKGSICRPETEN